MNNSVKNALRRIFPVFVIDFEKSVRRYVRQIQSRRFIKSVLLKSDEIFLEIGAGHKRGENGWVTLDLSVYSDICWDLTKGLPFPNDSIKKIYSSHILEHFSFGEGQRLLNECLRVLVQEGEFSICVPNARLFIEAYLTGEPLHTDDFYRPAYNNVSQIDYVNYVAYMDGQHKYMFDEDNLILILRRAGFKNVQLREYNPELDIQERDSVSIYAQAYK